MAPHISRRTVVALAALYGMFCWVSAPPRPFTTPDTAVYLEMQPLVPLGYPAFLRAAGENGVLWLQPLVFAIALAALGLELFALSGSLVFATFVMLGVTLTPDLRGYHATILTESLFASGLVAFIAAVVSFAREPSWKRAVVASLLAGATSTVRRTAWAFLPVLLLMVFMQRRRLGRAAWIAAGAAVCPMAVIVVIDHAATSLVHGEAATSLTGRHLFAKAALLDAPRGTPRSGDPIRNRLADALDTDFAPIRQLIAAAPREIRPVLVLYYESCLQTLCVTFLDGIAELPQAARHEVLSEVARARVASALPQFLRLGATHYVSLWSPYNYRHPGTAARLNEFLAAHRPLPFEREAFKVAPDDPIVFAPSPAVRFLLPAVQAVGWATAAVAFLGLVCAVRGAASPVAAAASVTALTAHAGLAFTAIGAAGLGRFMVALWPAVLVASCLALLWLHSVAWRRGRIAGPHGRSYH